MCGDSATAEPHTHRSVFPLSQALHARVPHAPQGLVRVPEPLELAREYQILIGLLVPVAVRVTARGIRHVANQYDCTVHRVTDDLSTRYQCQSAMYCFGCTGPFTHPDQSSRRTP